MILGGFRIGRITYFPLQNAAFGVNFLGNGTGRIFPSLGKHKTDENIDHSEHWNVRIRLKQEEEKVERLNLVMRAIRNVNQLLIKEKDPTKLLQGACENLI